MEVVLQDGIKDCGVCCLLSIIKHYKGNVSKEYLREWTNTTKDGVSAYKLVETANKVGFSSYGATGNINDLKNETLPVIAHVIINKKYQHFVVIYDIDYDKKKILLMDPSHGKRIISFAKFNLMSSGVFIFLLPAGNIISIMSTNKLRNMLGLFLKHYKKFIPFSIILTILLNILTIIVTYHFKYLQDVAINYNLSNNIVFISAIVFIIYLFKEFCSFLKERLLLKFSCLLDEEVMCNTFKQIILLPYLYYKNRTSGEVLSKIKDLTIVKNFIVSALSFLISDLLFIIVFIILLYNVSSTLASITIGILFIIALITYFFRNIISKYIKKYYTSVAIINSSLIENISSPNVIKTMHLEKTVIDKFNIKYKKYLDNAYNLYRSEGNERLIKSIILGFFNILILSIGSALVIKKQLSLGELIIFQSLLNNVLSSFNTLMSLYIEYHDYTLAKQRIEDLFIVKNEVFEGGAYYHNYSLLGTIKFKRFTYSYNNNKLLDDINLKIKKGEKVLLQGPSGCGKSTLVKSLMRYIDVPYGVISINNIDINHYHLDTIRKNIIYVSNQEYLFTDTLLENIKVYKTYDKEKIDEVCKITKVDEIIAEDNLGLNQLIEENGYNKSAGEKQRIILARTLLKESDIYIFDEAFSAIDINNCEIIMKDVFEYLKDKTIIVISHRLDSTKLFDRSLILKNHTLYEE